MLPATAISVALAIAVDYSQRIMVHLLLEWLAFAVALLVVAHLVPGFELDSFWSALWAAAAIALVNIFFGWLLFILHIITFPLSVITLGIFWFVVNGCFLYFASFFVPGFRIRNIFSATLAAAILALMHYLMTHISLPA